MTVMFEGWDAVVLARAQFAFTMSFHIVFPAFSIGLASYLAVLEALWLWTGREVFINLFNYWLKIFAVAFGMGVVSGIVMSYQFGTNWSAFSDKTGAVIGPVMAYEVLTAFFLEAGFLGVMLFGLERVGRRLHFVATLMVAIGTLISAVWILSANSLEADPGRLRRQCRRAVRRRRLAQGDFQSVVPLPPRAYGAGGLSTDGAGGRRRRSVSPAARSASPRPAGDVFDGDVDGDAGRADPDSGRRSAWPQHARASARQGDGDGGPLPEPPGRRAAAPVRPAGSSRGQGQIRNLGSQAWLADSQTFPGGAARGPRHRTARKLAAGPDHILVVLDHCRIRVFEDGARPLQPLGAMARHTLPFPCLLYTSPSPRD